MRLHRLVSILLTIENRGKVTVKTLAEQFETSKRTIYRDIDVLCEAGIPIITETGPNGGVSLMEGYRTGVKQLQKDEIIYLYLNGMGVKADRNSDIAMKLNSSLQKLQKLLSTSENQEINTLFNRFYVDDSPWWGKRESVKHLDTLMKAIWESLIICIHYQKTDNSLSVRDVRPYGIVVKEMKWYLVAYCEKSHNLRTFKCERITECQLLPEHFIIPHNFSLEKYFKESLAKFHSDCNAIEQYLVTLRMSKNDTWILESYENFSTKEDGDSIEVVMNMYSYETALNNFWNILAKSCVIDPPELKQAIKESLQGLLKYYM